MVVIPNLFSLSEDETSLAKMCLHVILKHFREWASERKPRSQTITKLLTFPVRGAEKKIKCPGQNALQASRRQQLSSQLRNQDLKEAWRLQAKVPKLKGMLNLK